MYRDTAGQEEFNSITEQYFRRAQGILLVYDITNQKSFDDLQMWTDKLKQVAIHASYNVLQRYCTMSVSC